MILAILMFAVPLDTLPSEASLMQCLSEYHAAATAATAEEYQFEERGRWLKYIPSVGIGYTLGAKDDGSLGTVIRPSVSINTSLIYQVQQDRRAQQAKLRSIQQTGTLDYQDDLRQLKALLDEHHSATVDLQFATEIMEIDSSIFDLTQRQYDQLEIAPSQFLPKLKAFRKQQYDLFLRREELRKLERQIIILARCDG